MNSSSVSTVAVEQSSAVGVFSELQPTNWLLPESRVCAGVSVADHTVPAMGGSRGVPVAYAQGLAPPPFFARTRTR